MSTASGQGLIGRAVFPHSPQPSRSSRCAAWGSVAGLDDRHRGPSPKTPRRWRPGGRRDWLRIELDAEEAEPGRRRSARGRVLADPAVKTSASRPPSATAMRPRPWRLGTRRPRVPAGPRLVRALELSDVAGEAGEPGQPDSCSSAGSSARASSWVAQQVTSAPGVTEPGRVAIGTPSSGVKPIVVSTERPSRTAVTEQPPPRWQTTSRGRRHLLARPLDRQAVEAVAADSPIARTAPGSA